MVFYLKCISCNGPCFSLSGCSSIATRRFPCFKMVCFLQTAHAKPVMFDFCLAHIPAHYAFGKASDYSSSRVVPCAWECLSSQILLWLALACSVFQHLYVCRVHSSMGDWGLLGTALAIHPECHCHQRTHWRCALPCPALCPAQPCRALPCPALPCPALPCPALPRPALTCPTMQCPALPCPALSCPAVPCLAFGQRCTYATSASRQL